VKPKAVKNQVEKIKFYKEVFCATEGRTTILYLKIQLSRSVLYPAKIDVIYNYVNIINKKIDLTEAQ